MFWKERSITHRSDPENRTPSPSPLSPNFFFFCFSQFTNVSRNRVPSKVTVFSGRERTLFWEGGRGFISFSRLFFYFYFHLFFFTFFLLFPPFSLLNFLILPPLPRSSHSPLQSYPTYLSKILPFPNFLRRSLPPRKNSAHPPTLALKRTYTRKKKPALYPFSPTSI